MREYAVYLPPNDLVGSAIFVKENFHFLAFFFTFLWALVKRLYNTSIVLLCITILIEVFYYYATHHIEANMWYPIIVDYGVCGL